MHLKSFISHPKQILLQNNINNIAQSFGNIVNR